MDTGLALIVLKELAHRIDESNNNIEKNLKLYESLMASFNWEQLAPLSVKIKDDINHSKKLTNMLEEGYGKILNPRSDRLVGPPN